MLLISVYDFLYVEVKQIHFHLGRPCRREQRACLQQFLHYLWLMVEQHNCNISFSKSILENTYINNTYLKRGRIHLNRSSTTSSTRLVVMLSRSTIFGLLCTHTRTDAPVCVAGAAVVLMVGASLEESVAVPCRVAADPPDVAFEWTFTSSGERFEVQHGPQQQQHQSTSIGGGGGQQDGGRTAIIESNETHAESDGK